MDKRKRKFVKTKVIADPENRFEHQIAESGIKSLADVRYYEE